MPFEEMTPEDLELLKTRLNKVVDLIMETTQINTECNDIIKCKELQLVHMDLVSISEHLTKLNEDGPSAPFAEVPLIQPEEEVNAASY